MTATDRVDAIMAAWARERPDLDVSPQAVIGRLHRLAGRLTEDLVPIYHQHGLGEGDFDVLATLRRSGEPYESTPGELAGSTMVTTGAMSKRVDRLEVGGWVTRRASDDDGRGRVITLTPAGRDLIDQAFTAHIANEHRLLEAITPEQQQILAAILRQWLLRYENPLS